MISKIKIKFKNQRQVNFYPANGGIESSHPAMKAGYADPLPPHSLQSGFLAASGIKSGAGFTLIELIVAIGILTMILSLSITNYRGSNQATLVQLEAYRIIADLRKLQNMALSAIEFDSTVPSGGWGISYTATANSYILFADIDDDGIYDGVGELHQTINMDSNIIFSNSGIITFEPPDPTTNFSSAGSEQTIIITDNTTTQSVTVNLLGLIDVVN